jgi:hypothetical protein
MNEEQHLYNWQPFAHSSDPRFPDLSKVHGDDVPKVYLDGQCVNGRIRWCVSGNPGMVSLWVKVDGHFIVDESTGRAKHELLRGLVEVFPLDEAKESVT